MWFLLFTTWTSNFESSNSYSSTMFLHGENPKKNNIPRIFPSPPAAPCNASARHWNPALPGFPMILLVCQNSPSCTPKTGPKRTSSQPKKKPKDLNQGNAADVSWNGSTGKKKRKSTQQGKSLDLTLLYNKSLSCWSCSTFTCKATRESWICCQPF